MHLKVGQDVKEMGGSKQQHQPKSLCPWSGTSVNSHPTSSISIKYCEYTWPWSQLEAANQQHSMLWHHLCWTATNVSLHTVLQNRSGLSCQITVIDRSTIWHAHTLLRSGVERGALPSPARPKRKSHATEGTRLHRPWAASFLTLYAFNTLPFCSPSRTHTVRLPRRLPSQSLRAYAAILKHWPCFFVKWSITGPPILRDQ